MTPTPTADELNALLCQADPMGTGCARDAGMQDEYWTQARDAAEAIAAGTPARQALVQAFEEAFWPGCLQGDRAQAALQRVLDAQAPQPGAR